MKRVLAVCGPTASGKTALAIHLALQFDGEIISADSMQIYRGLDIGTAKPSADDMSIVPHHMIDIADTSEKYSVSRFQREATVCAEDALHRGKLPIICGGTGLYVDALISGREYSPVGDDGRLREELEREYYERGAAAMHERLAAVDAESAARLHVNDKKRVLRALEVYAQTGGTITDHNARSRLIPPRYDAFMLGLDPGRERLYERIGLRVKTMLEHGLEHEARELFERGKLMGTAAQAIGYKELADYFCGKVTLDEATELLCRKTRNLAKRQMTWLRADDRIAWLCYNSRISGELTVPEAAQTSGWEQFVSEKTRILESSTEYFSANS